MCDHDTNVGKIPIIHTLTKPVPLKRKDCHTKDNEFGIHLQSLLYAFVAWISKFHHLSLSENSWNKHWVLQIFHEIYHKHKTHGISYKIQPYTVHVNKTIIDGPIPLTSVLSVTPKISVELKINSFSPLSVRQGPYTILKDLSLLPA